MSELRPSRFSIFLVALGLMVAPFQNCGPKGFSGGSQEPAAAASHTLTTGGEDIVNLQNGNGNGYEGKTFIVRDLYHECTDGDPALSRILQPAGQTQYYLVRQNCVNFAPQAIVATQVTSSCPSSAGCTQEQVVYGQTPFDRER